MTKKGTFLFVFCNICGARHARQVQHPSVCVDCYRWTFPLLVHRPYLLRSHCVCATTPLLHPLIFSH